ncbi:FecR family protein [Yeosuana marina]|uniref:FecR family protein n=1 Tax=Yeosuana marina TaxID=1565536 RepID=UPI0030EB2BCF|tara:strand:+ start:2103 stop:3281 length:1179 start_codon:yes stop_codon:yes gene_type:complete
MNDIFHISKLLIKKRLKVLTASDELQLKKFNKEYPFSKEVKIDELIDKIEDYNTINKEKAWESIEKKSQNRKEKPVFRLSKKTWYKYVAAAIVIGVLTTTYFLKDNIFNSYVEPSPTIVNTNTDNIEPGTDKATLTLEDGSVVILEKGDTYQTQNANSNGQQIVYKPVKQNPSEIVYNYLTIPRGGQFFIKLSDGTQVWLNSESQLKYPVSFIEGETRKVELVYGEAYFDVSPSTQHKGSKFQVFNKSQLVEVIGTEFNIKAYKDESNIYTTLVEGKVAISSDSQREKLIPGQQSNLNLENKNITISKVDVNAETSWRNGIFSFRGKPLKDIMKVISRWYDVDVVFENKKLEDITFKGVLGKNQDIQEILETIKSLSVIKNYEINGKQIILK